MKKVFPFVALALAAAGSWAFYPKVAEPPQYMTIVVSFYDVRANRADASITVVLPNEPPKEQVLSFEKGERKKLTDNMIAVHKAALATVNSYSRSGWRLVNASPSGLSLGGDTLTYQNVYLMEKL